MTAMPTIATDRISTGALEALRREDPLVRILDVRTGGEFETAHIPGSYNVPLDTLAEHVAEFARVEHPVVLVCQTGGRAGQAHSTLTGAGKQTLHILDGGINAWTAAGGEVTRSEHQRWPMDRQVRLFAGVSATVAVLLSIFVPRSKWLAAAVGAGLTHSAVTDTCLVAPVLAKLPYNRTDPCDVEGVLADLAGRSG
jgi:rhodanese-related sulfurtransferase